ncbi:MAG: polymer-forming cytoskeletal protein [Anaerolineales bacterium]|nr:polymer-forming cytoskeletal protein [Anaerolineales bacterium]
MKKVLVAAVVVSVLTLMMPFPVFASGFQDGKIVFGEDFTLQSGEEINGDLLVLGGSLVMEEGSFVDGDILVLGGNVVCSGEVAGTLSAVGGDVRLEETAVIQGDTATIGGNISRAAGAVIEGQEITGNSIDIPDDFDLSMPINQIENVPSVRFTQTPVWDVMWYLFRSVVLAGLAALVVLFWPQPARRMADVIVEHPLSAGGVGLLTFLVAPILLLLLTITIILIPVSIVAVIALIVAVVYGWISLGLEIGERIAKSAHWDLHAAAAAALGTSILSLVVGGIGFAPCIGWIAPFTVMVLGLGATILTLFGSREYQLRSATAAALASAAPVVPAGEQVDESAAEDEA